MRILITGTAGFIGFHLARRLLAEGHVVTGIDGFTSYYDVGLKRARHSILKDSPAFIEKVEMLEHADAVMAIAETSKPEVIVHLAAQAGVRYSLENPRAYVDSNLIGTFNVLEAARRAGVTHLLLASTSSIYGANPEMPFEETQRTDHPLTLYAATKKATEDMAHSYSFLWSIPTTAMRFFSVYGPWGRPDMALFKFVDAILNGRPIDIYNGGEMWRDFTYIDDLVESIVRLIATVPRAGEPCVTAADSLSPVAPYRTVNVGGGSTVKLLTFIEEIEQALGRVAIRNMMPLQLGDVPATHANPALLRALTGFTPATPTRDGIATFCGWYKSYFRQG